ncbi:uncharacterized protein LOC129259198 isoform X1 [Lytechinus pictus]|uniref:uncharacterized protein LOC129259198 isoform X1 n=1 Tax=Lytechinus pictus TaxID=7653 RepID=UPI0030B9C57F
MPGLNRGTYLQLALLLLIVPAQYFLTQWKPTTSTQRSIEIERLLTRLHLWHGKFTNPDWWNQRALNAWNTMADFIDHIENYGERLMYGASSKTSDFDENEPEGESPAYEVLKFRESNGYFGGSTEKRSPRPRHVRYRIGQVVRHKRMGYRGVIVGWDLTATAPAQWLKDNISPDQQHTVNAPFYALLLDIRDIHVPVPVIVYNSEEDLEVISFQTMVQHPQIDEYFEAFDGSRFLARSWLKKIYPHDQ